MSIYDNNDSESDGEQTETASEPNTGGSSSPSSTSGGGESQPEETETTSVDFSGLGDDGNESGGEPTESTSGSEEADGDGGAGLVLWGIAAAIIALVFGVVDPSEGGGNDEPGLL